MFTEIKKLSLILGEKIKEQIILRWIEKRRQRLDIQLETREIYGIRAQIKAPINFLVFGLGNDSALWHDLNPGGRTAFLEDDQAWLEKIKKAQPRLEAYLIHYTTRLNDWRDLIDQPEKLALPLPPKVIATEWDLILVDGPAGWREDKPGRMQSIYSAAQLIKPGGDIFVHDCDREIEDKYANKYLGQQNIIAEIRGRALLRHYRRGAI
ncbi:MAG: hypothetical protein WC456_04785 [Patescibacteria group bacterium]